MSPAFQSLSPRRSLKASADRADATASRPTGRPTLEPATAPAVPLFLQHEPERPSAATARPFLETATSTRGSPARDFGGSAKALGPIAHLHDDPASHRAAEAIGAYAFAFRGDVFLGNRLGAPGAPSREEAIRHELVHARQHRRPGTPAAPKLLESEARSAAPDAARLGADPEEPQGLWWVIPAFIGGYILLRPTPANAPGPNDKILPRVSEAQIVGESLALFAVPGGVTRGLARLGYGVVSAYAVGGAASSMTYRGVQDVGAGEFSGVEAYVIDGTTGAVIGAVVGGVFKPFGNLRGPLRGPAPNTRPLVHLTDPQGATGIGSSNVLRGSQGIYALPAGAQNQNAAVRVLRTLLRPAQTNSSVLVNPNASGVFRQPVPMGPLSTYQRLMGVYRAPAGQINQLTGAFTPSASRLANITGQFFPYGVDGMLWITAGAAGSALSPAKEGSRDRSLFSPFYQMTAGRDPLPFNERSDGPFIFVGPTEDSGNPFGGPESDPFSDPFGQGQGPLMDDDTYGLGPGPWSNETLEAARIERTRPAAPAVIFVNPTPTFGADPLVGPPAPEP